MENKLLNHPGQEPGVMTEAEFAEAADAMIAVTSDKLRQRLFKEAETYVSSMDKIDNGVPILRLARIL